MKTAYLVNSPLNNKYLSDAFGKDHDSSFAESNAFTADASALNQRIQAFSSRNKAYDSAKNQGHLHGFEPIVVKVHIDRENVKRVLAFMDSIKTKKQ